MLTEGLESMTYLEVYLQLITQQKKPPESTNMVELGLYELLSELLVSPLITPIVVPYIIPI